MPSLSLLQGQRREHYLWIKTAFSLCGSPFSVPSRARQHSKTSPNLLGIVACSKIEPRKKPKTIDLRTKRKSKPLGGEWLVTESCIESIVMREWFQSLDRKFISETPEELSTIKTHEDRLEFDYSALRIPNLATSPRRIESRATKITDEDLLRLFDFKYEISSEDPELEFDYSSLKI
jgi:hypothetical protein